jgi:3-isopropylmalate/(R)-2-methylmalate dehydratase small subunit
MITTQDPNVEFSLNLNDMTVTAGNTNISVAMHPSIRKALVEGTWDSTSMMLENVGQVENVSERLIKMLA